MDRRTALGRLGIIGAGATAGLAQANDGHGELAADGKGYMAPVTGIHLHFCGIHIAKTNPKFQIITQHYCAPVGEEMHQCLLYDSHGKNARLLGVEYIITDKVFRQLPDAEKKYWHPHTYEVLGGGLIAPGMKPEDEMKFMKYVLTTWGKTWHTWPDPSTAVPMGEPLLMWSLTADGQEDKSVVAARDRQFGVSIEKIRALRCNEIGYDVPNVSSPTSMDQIGRQWTDNGEDKPTPRKASGG